MSKEFIKIPAVYMRGGTSKGVYLMASDLPDDPAYKEMEKKEMTNLVPGYMKSDDFRKSWDAEFDGYYKVFSELGLVKQK